ncbi:Serpentine receptor class alpha/beta-14 [Toxocara canis]|uniref:Serpentine receptor class alpha/beta-14 n=1 Tax=Toxocara canis TaxID=6265 RepID=A0A0B2VIL1_TOXCA|nr:Serpentine receptor class alpha/beta-14 [Toxocara canis]
MTTTNEDPGNTDLTSIVFTVPRLLLSAAGILLLSIVFKREVRSKQNHPNAKCLLLLHYAAIMLSAAVLAGVSIWNLCDPQSADKVRAKGNTAKKPELRRVCLYMSIYGNAVSMAAMFSLGIERALSTVKAQNYEHSSRIVGIFLFIASNLAGAVTDILMIVNQSSSFYSIATTILHCFAGLEVVTITVFALLYAYNVKWMRSKDRIFASLSHKYQMEENSLSISRLLPMATVQTTLNLTNLIVKPIILTANQSGRFLPAAYFDLMPFYYVLLPIITLWRQRNRRVKTVTEGPQNRSTKAENDKHFRMLHSMFNADLRPPMVNSVRVCG